MWIIDCSSTLKFFKCCSNFINEVWNMTDRYISASDCSPPVSDRYPPISQCRSMSSYIRASNIHAVVDASMLPKFEQNRHAKSIELYKCPIASILIRSQCRMIGGHTHVSSDLCKSFNIAGVVQWILWQQHASHVRIEYNSRWTDNL